MLSATRFFSATPQSPISAVEEDRFFRNIRTSNGTYKHTERHRLDRVNELFFDVIARLGTTISTVADIGISSGVTTAEWMDEFERRGMHVKMHASDLTISAYIADIGAGVRVLLERDGHVLQIEVWGHGVRTWFRRFRDFMTGAVIWRPAAVALVRRRLQTLGIVVSSSGSRELVRDHQSLRGPFQLLSRMLTEKKNVVVFEEDVLVTASETSSERFDVIRVANVLQYRYFNACQVQSAAMNIRSRCRGEGSLAIICRNHPGSLDASLLKLDGRGRFTVAARLGRGSEVEAVFTGLPAS